MKVTQNLVTADKYSIKCPYAMTAECIVVHNTANDASAANEIAYMIRNDNKVSFHYAVDDKEIVQGIPESRNAYHAGDGKKGKGNRTGIGIEICYSKSGGAKFVAAEKLAAKFIAHKLQEKGWGIDRVKKHQDFSGKYCPHRTLDMGWERFLNMVRAEMSPTAQKPTEAPTASTEAVYTVQKGDTLSGIAFDYGVTVDDIAKYNGITNPNLIHPGQTLKIPVALKPLSEIAKEVIRGEWGNGITRKKRLTAAGYDYDDVQARVAVLLKK